MKKKEKKNSQIKITQMLTRKRPHVKTFNNIGDATQEEQRLTNNGYTISNVQTISEDNGKITFSCDIDEQRTWLITSILLFVISVVLYFVLNKKTLF